MGVNQFDEANSDRRHEIGSQRDRPKRRWKQGQWQRRRQRKKRRRSSGSGEGSQRRGLEAIDEETKGIVKEKEAKEEGVHVKTVKNEEEEEEEQEAKCEGG